MHRPRVAFDCLEPRHFLAGVGGFVEADGDVVGVQLTGPGDLIVTGGTQPSLTVTNSGATSELRITLVQQGLGSDGRIQWNRVRSTGLRLFSAPQVDFTAGGTDVEFTGHVGEIVVGDLTTGNFNIHFRGPIDITNPRPANRIRSFAARHIIDTHISTTGWFDSFTAANITGQVGLAGPYIQSLKIRTLRVENQFGAPGTLGLGARFSLFALRDPQTNSQLNDREWGVQTITVTGGLLGGQWDIPGACRSIRLGGVADGSGNFNSNGHQAFPELNVSVIGRLGSVYSARDLRGFFGAVEFGTVQAIDDVDLNIQTFTTGSIASIRGEEVHLQSTFHGGISQIVAASFLGGSTFAGAIDSLLVTGGIRGPGHMEFSAVIGLNGVPGGRAYALGTVTVAGTWSNTRFDILGNVRQIDVGGMNNAALFAGVPFGTVTVPLEFSTVTSANFNPALGGLVKTLRVRAPHGDAPSFVNSFVLARRIESLRLDGRAQVNNGGTIFGIKVDEPAISLKIRVQSQTVTNPATVFFATLDFQFEVL